MAIQTNWAEKETTVALWLYCQIPFSKVTNSHPLIQQYAKIIGRNENALKMKIGNFGSFDPSLRDRGIVGLRNSSKMDVQIWEKYKDNFEKLNEDALSLIENKQLGNQTIFEDIENRETESIATTKTRKNQQFFRQMVLSSYNTTCCISGITVPELLVASHIIPWSQDSTSRLNPANGLCLNALLDKAYDRGLISVTPDYDIMVSEYLLEKASDTFSIYHKKKILFPERFMPDPEFLSYHFLNIFQK